MGIGDRYVYTMEGIGRKPHIHRHFRKFIASSFLMFSNTLQPHIQPIKLICDPKSGKTMGMFDVFDAIQGKTGQEDQNRYLNTYFMFFSV